ncbi:MAG: hypothetical protein ACK5O2_12585 [Microthrixaceae bacterium]
MSSLSSGATTSRGSTTRFVEAAEAAQRRALVVGVAAAVVVGIVLGAVLVVVANVVVGLLVAVAIMVIGAGAWALYVQSAMAGAADAVLDGLGTEVGPGEHESLRNALDGVAILTGVKVPTLRVLVGDSANAMAIQGLDEDSTVVVTSALLDGCRVVEAEALAAELLCRVRDGSARYLALASGLPAAVRSAAGITEASVAAAIGEQRAVHGDADAVSVTRYPPALQSALERMASTGTAVSAASPGTAALWIAPAVGTERGVPEAVARSVNQDLGYRIAALREL